MRRTFLLALAAAALTVGWHGSPPVAGQVPDGVGMVLKQFADTLGRIGIKRVQEAKRMRGLFP